MSEDLRLNVVFAATYKGFITVKESNILYKVIID